MARTAWRDLIPIKTLTEPLWGRQVGEGARAFRAWAIYRDLPLRERSKKLAAERYGASESMLHDWSKVFRWKERIDAWDIHCEEVAVQAQEDEIRAMNERHARLGFEGMKVVMQRLIGDDAAGVQAIDPSKLSARDLAAIAPVMSKIERLARGAESERIEGSVASQPLTVLLSFDPAPRIMDDVDANGYAENDIFQMAPQRELPPAA